MRYASIDSFDICNGEGVGVSLFVQGCPFRCHGCFNYETWEFDGGHEWTEDIEEKFFKLVDRPYVKRISILGGEALADKNLDGVLKLVNQIRSLFPEKAIWIYTGYQWEQIIYPIISADYDSKKALMDKRKEIVCMADVLVDGRFENDKKDLSLKFRGSTNQRIIDIKKSLDKGDVILWDTFYI